MLDAEAYFLISTCSKNKAKIKHSQEGKPGWIRWYAIRIKHVMVQVLSDETTFLENLQGKPSALENKHTAFSKLTC